MYGFFNLVLNVDLERQSFEIQSLPDSVLQRGLGGKGVGTWLLLEKNQPRVDPLGPENHLVFATGPVTGSPIYGSCRFGVFTKSPLTGFYSESYSGGWVPEAMSRTGFDAIVIRGASPEPTVLEVNETGASFHPASDLWGLETYETEKEVMGRWGLHQRGAQKSGTAVIGPAGENLVRFALIENDRWRSAGRTGAGAVMGSKKLKAVVFNGARRRQWADPDRMEHFVRSIRERARNDKGVNAYKNLGTPMLVAIMNAAGGFPTKYWSQGKFQDWEKISAEALQDRCKVRSHACLRCLMGCGKISTIKSGPHAGLTVEGPEYETIYAFGGLCMIGAIEDIIYLNDLCDRFGLDTITAGNLCAFAIEASRRGKIREKLEYGNAGQIAGLLRQMTFRQGIGAVLAEGIRHASKEWDLEDLAIHVKGLEPAGYDPRLLKGTGLGYAVSPRGACHLRATFYKPELSGIIPPEQIQDKAELFIQYEDRLAVFDALILCRFYRDLYPWNELSTIVECTTGMRLDEKGLRALASRVIDDTRRFNLREGLTPDDDTLPRRFYREPLASGHAITEDELLQLRSDYYRLRGWDQNGNVP